MHPDPVNTTTPHSVHTAEASDAEIDCCSETLPARNFSAVSGYARFFFRSKNIYITCSKRGPNFSLREGKRGERRVVEECCRAITLPGGGVGLGGCHTAADHVPLSFGFGFQLDFLLHTCTYVSICRVISDLRNIRKVCIVNLSGEATVGMWWKNTAGR